MYHNSIPSNACVYAFLKMQFQVDAKYDLQKEHEHEGGGKCRMDVGCKLTPAVSVPEKVAYYCEHGASDLQRDVPPRTDNLVEMIQHSGRLPELGGLGRKRTPRTMPVGKIRPKEIIWMIM